jgi:PHD/YefM family antitoxin component YafN of YafNO toxin-antitoxin module
MKSTLNLAAAQAQLPRLIRQLERTGDTIAITRHDETVAYLLSRERLEAIIETLEIMGDARAMSQIRKHRAGKLKFHPLSAADEGES